jgi:hypothetical protein
VYKPLRLAGTSSIERIAAREYAAEVDLFIAVTPRAW